MKNGAFLYAVGLVTGALIMSATHSIWHQAERVTQHGADEQETVHMDTRTEAKDSEPEPGPTLTAETSIAETPKIGPAASGMSAATVPPDAATQLQPARVDMPDLYASMIEPQPLPETLAPPELFERFTDDVRDEAWAYPMELGINQYFARRGGELETAVEFVECRSRYCTIAGVVYDGGQATVNEVLSEMTQSGWWQTFGGASTVGRTTGTEYRFVTIFPRTREDTDRSQAPDQTEQKAAESAAQTVET